MDFSVGFFVFLIGALFVFYAIRPKKLRPLVLALESIGFCAVLSPVAAVNLVIISLMTFLAAYFIVSFRAKSNQKASRFTYILSVILALAELFVYKYSEWILCKMLMIKSLSPFFENLVIPVGLSFYTFSVIDYLSDIYKGNTEFEKNPLNLFLYLTYFPKFLSGPIEKNTRFFENLRKLEAVRLLDSERLVKAVSFLLTGYFMKLVLADRAALFVNDIFLFPEYYGTGILILGSLLYTLQIYFDFAGYSFIAMGVSKLFGIDLSDNFRTPYFSENITEFWRRWHISLSGFFKEHVYIPLGGNRKGDMRTYLNLLTVFIVCGIWHGAAVRFVFWGLLHGVFSVLARVLKKRNIKMFVSGVSGRITTFICVSFAWIFFGAAYFRGALKYIGCMFSHIPNAFVRRAEGVRAVIEDFFGGYRLFNGNMYQFIVFVITFVFVFVLEWMSYKKSLTVPEMLSGAKPWVRYVYWYLLLMGILILGIYGVEAKNADFIYMDF